LLWLLARRKKKLLLLLRHRLLKPPLRPLPPLRLLTLPPLRPLRLLLTPLLRLLRLLLRPLRLLLTLLPLLLLRLLRSNQHCFIKTGLRAGFFSSRFLLRGDGMAVAIKKPARRPVFIWERRRITSARPPAASGS
jgi:hypothetical protein